MEIASARPQHGSPGFSRCAAGTGWSRDSWGAVRYQCNHHGHV